MTLVRSTQNPILSRKDIPDIPGVMTDVTSVFNPGAVKFDGCYLLLLRVQTRARETVLMLAESADGEHFKVRPQLIRITGIERIRERLYHIYDPRITTIDGMYYIMLAADTDAGCRMLTVVTQDFTHFEMLAFESMGDTRNGVLFPQHSAGGYLRLERPNTAHPAGGAATGSAITLSTSSDLQRWTCCGTVLAGRPRYWDELIGAGPPPLKTRAGWVLVYHGVATHFASVNIYQAGVALLDLEQPRRVLGRSSCNILEPREQYELTGQVPNVVFPSGMIAEEQDSEGYIPPTSLLNIYYGAADTCIGLAQCTMNDLLSACDPLPFV